MLKLPYSRMLPVLFVLLAIFGLTGCNEEAKEKVMAQQAMALESGDECHLCGMLITRFPGPKGQVFERGIKQNMKFCSTRDMFAYALDPEHKHNIQSVFVHDMAVNPWEKPTDETYIDGRKAWFVIGSSKKGAMGPTLASFKTQEDAEAFAKEFGGELKRFDELTLDII
ncbi:nitrous oxide reductase accessory protein NosL [Neptunomonas antarctica]|uniref:Copper chaperone NosL n=1 Tax=Neptunomonas antarctica TaxID=619304 RepID=A0A1N7J0D0_9GAMM|nr:nitrous oxide reductase accessory protein NosL [Neptunomonas antarctica]SIS42744.1 copper chaperone NosL [Neptunomonas antarctica]